MSLLSAHLRVLRAVSSELDTASAAARRKPAREFMAGIAGALAAAADRLASEEQALEARLDRGDQ